MVVQKTNGVSKDEWGGNKAGCCIGSRTLWPDCGIEKPGSGERAVSDLVASELGVGAMAIGDSEAIALPKNKSVAAAGSAKRFLRLVRQIEA